MLGARREKYDLTSGQCLNERAMARLLTREQHLSISPQLSNSELDMLCARCHNDCG